MSYHALIMSSPASQLKHFSSHWLILISVLSVFCVALICIDCFCTMYHCRDHLEIYTSDYTLQVLVGYCAVYIFMQTFMIPGTVFMSLLAGALFGVLKGVALVVITATAGASSCYFLSKLVGRPLVISLWPDKLSFFQAQVISTPCSVSCLFLTLS